MQRIHSEGGKVKSIFKILAFVVALLASIKLLNVSLAMVSAKSDAAVFGGAILLVVLGCAWVVAITRFLNSTRKQSTSTLFLAVLMFGLASGGCTKVSPGYAGIKVNMYGSGKGVDQSPEVTGMVWYNPITTDILRYPTFVQTAVWTKDPKEGKAQNEEISFNSKEGLVITGDISLSYQLDPAKVPAFYVKFRSDDLDHFTHGFLRNVARDSFNEAAAKYSVDELYGAKKEEFLKEVKGRVNRQVGDFGVEIQQFGFVGAPRLPEKVVEALNAKISAVQDAIKAENQLRQTEAEAKKRVAAATGESESNIKLASSLSPQLLEWRRLEIQLKMLEKWNGQMPLYTGGGTPLIQLPTPK